MTMTHFRALPRLVLTLCLLLAFPTLYDKPAMAQSGTLCPPLPAPTGNIIHIYPSQVSDLKSLVLNAAPGDTFLLHDGLYPIPYNDYIYIKTPGVTLRSASGNPQAVIIDGTYNDGPFGRDLVTIAASNVTVADLTVQRAYNHPIHVYPHPENTADITNTVIYNVRIIDPGQQAIKINPYGDTYADNGLVACSYLQLTDSGRTHIRDDCYTGGVDGHQARGWVIRDNTVEGFWCEQGLAEHGVHFWTGSRDTVVERNVMRNNTRGIGFGLGQNDGGRLYHPDPCPEAEGYVGHFDGVIRNNAIFANRTALFSSSSGFDCGICLAQACGTQVLHNTVVSTMAPFSSIEWRFSNTNATLTNNLVSHNLRPREGAVAVLTANLANAPLSLFVDGSGGNLHLAADATAAIDQGASLAPTLCDDDIDGDLRPVGEAPDIGADEYRVMVLDQKVWLPLILKENDQ